MGLVPCLSQGTETRRADAGVEIERQREVTVLSVAEERCNVLKNDDKVLMDPIRKII